MKRYFLIILSTLILIGCVKVIEIPAPAFAKKAVLVGILKTNAPITISLRYNLKADSKDSLYPVIANAKVSFYENDQTIGQGKYVGDGLYTLAYTPKQAKTYKVVADIPNYGKLEATEKIPSEPTFQLTVSNKNEKNPNQNPDVTVIFKRNNTWEHYYWLSVYEKTENYKWAGPGICNNLPSGNVPPECYMVTFLSTETNIFATNSELSDRFNGFYDSLTGIYTYTRFMRLDNNSMKGNDVNIQFTFSNKITNQSDKGAASIIRLMATGAGFDKFLKSSIASSYNRPADAYGNLNNPFAEPMAVYSNVKNGLGVFGSLIEKEQKIPVFK